MPSPQSLANSPRTCVRTVYPYVMAAVVFASILAITFAWAPNYRWSESMSDQPYGADFLQEWVGGRLIIAGRAGDLYDGHAFREWQHDRDLVGFEWNPARFFPAVYPPLHYALFASLAWIPYRWAALVWVSILWGLVFINAYGIAAIFRHEAKLSGWRPSTLRCSSSCAWILLILFPAVPIAVMFGQKSLVWVAILCWTCRLLQLGKPATAGLVFALISLKPTLFFFLPCVMARYTNWRFVAGCAVGATVMWGLALVLLPWSMWQGFLETVSASAQYGTQGGYRNDWSCSIWSIAKSMPDGWQPWVFFGVCIPMALFVLAGAMRGGGIASNPNKLFVTLAATMLVAPHAYHYDLCILMVPLGWVAARDLHLAASTYAALSFAIALSPALYPLMPVPWLAIVLWGCAAVWVLRSGVGASVERCTEPEGSYRGSLQVASR